MQTTKRQQFIKNDQPIKQDSKLQWNNSIKKN